MRAGRPFLVGEQHLERTCGARCVAFRKVETGGLGGASAVRSCAAATTRGSTCQTSNHALIGPCTSLRLPRLLRWYSFVRYFLFSASIFPLAPPPARRPTTRFGTRSWARTIHRASAFPSLRRELGTHSGPARSRSCSLIFSAVVLAFRSRGGNNSCSANRRVVGVFPFHHRFCSEQGSLVLCVLRNFIPSCCLSSALPVRRVPPKVGRMIAASDRDLHANPCICSLPSFEKESQTGHARSGRLEDSTAGHGGRRSSAHARLLATFVQATIELARGMMRTRQSMFTGSAMDSASSPLQIRNTHAHRETTLRQTRCSNIGVPITGKTPCTSVILPVKHDIGVSCYR